MKTLLVVDDHPIVLEGLHSVLTRKGFKVIKASSAEQALSLAEHVESIDMFVIDLSLSKGNDGLQLISDIRDLGVRKPTIIYTMHEELWNIAHLLKVDVEGIVLKGDNIAELLLAIDTVSNGRKFRSESFDRKRQETLMTSGLLSSIDIEVLRRIANGTGNKEIATQLNISEKTVEYHRSNILKKLCSKTMTEATRRAISLGIIYLMFLLVTPLRSFAATPEPQPVDLGLSVLWADHNLGAESPQEAGGYYAFAETETKETYNWNTYTHCDNDMFKCYDLGIDNISGTNYDAAHVYLGNGWRMPTQKEAAELLAACTCQIVTIDDKTYAHLSAPNGNYILLSICGYRNGNRVLYDNWDGTYYVSDFEYEEMTEDGIIYSLLSPNYFAITPEQIAPSMVGSPQLGMNIRPVKDKSDLSAIENIPADPAAGGSTRVFTLDGIELQPIPAGSTSLPASLPAGIYIIVRPDGTSDKIIKSN